MKKIFVSLSIALFSLSAFACPGAGQIKLVSKDNKEIGTVNFYEGKITLTNGYKILGIQQNYQIPNSDICEIGWPLDNGDWAKPLNCRDASEIKIPKDFYQKNLSEDGIVPEFYIHLYKKKTFETEGMSTFTIRGNFDPSQPVARSLDCGLTLSPEL